MLDIVVKYQSDFDHMEKEDHSYSKSGDAFEFWRKTEAIKMTDHEVVYHEQSKSTYKPWIHKV